jgi:hypothetical protein
MLAARTYHIVLALGAGQTKNCLAARTLAVHVSFPVLKFIFSKLEKIAEFFVFTAAFCYFS